MSKKIKITEAELVNVVKLLVESEIDFADEFFEIEGAALITTPFFDSGYKLDLIDIGSYYTFMFWSMDTNRKRTVLINKEYVRRIKTIKSVLPKKREDLIKKMNKGELFKISDWVNTLKKKINEMNVPLGNFLRKKLGNCDVYLEDSGSRSHKYYFVDNGTHVASCTFNGGFSVFLAHDMDFDYFGLDELEVEDSLVLKKIIGDIFDILNKEENIRFGSFREFSIHQYFSEARKIGKGSEVFDFLK